MSGSMRALTRRCQLLVSTLVVSCATAGSAAAQEAATWFVGGVGGISALSADARSQIASETVAVSLYGPENGPALNLFVGRHLGEYVTLQANHVWNHNDLVLVSAQIADERASFYEQARTSAQHAVVGDVLVYFRERRSRLRPYLSAGIGMVRFKSRGEGPVVARRSALPPEAFAETQATLRVAVGMDLVIADGWRVRYSFSESLSGNPISARLSPPAPRNLANFQNLVGLLREF